MTFTPLIPYLKINLDLVNVMFYPVFTVWNVAMFNLSVTEQYITQYVVC